MQKKRISAWAMLVSSLLICVAPCMGHSNETSKEENLEQQEMFTQHSINVASEALTTQQHMRQIVQVNIQTITEQKKTEKQQKIQNLDSNDKKQWIIQYKQIQEEYSEWIEPDKTIYDEFTEDELWWLFHIVEAEVTGDKWFDEKVNVASVIFNRIELQDPEFGLDIISILHKSGQFSTYDDNRYNEIVVTDTVKLACEYAYIHGDTTNGALWFDSKRGNSWAATHRTFLFTDEVSHNFYR